MDSTKLLNKNSAIWSGVLNPPPLGVATEEIYGGLRFFMAGNPFWGVGLAQSPWLCLYWGPPYFIGPLRSAKAWLPAQMSQISGFFVILSWSCVYTYITCGLTISTSDPLVPGNHYHGKGILALISLAPHSLRDFSRHPWYHCEGLDLLLALVLPPC